jgi:hypothetical protein
MTHIAGFGRDRGRRVPVLKRAAPPGSPIFARGKPSLNASFFGGTEPQREAKWASAASISIDGAEATIWSTHTGATRFLDI